MLQCFISSVMWLELGWFIPQVKCGSHLGIFNLGFWSVYSRCSCLAFLSLKSYSIQQCHLVKALALYWLHSARQSSTKSYLSHGGDLVTILIHAWTQSFSCFALLSSHEEIPWSLWSGGGPMTNIPQQALYFYIPWGELHSLTLCEVVSPLFYEAEPTHDFCQDAVPRSTLDISVGSWDDVPKKHSLPSSSHLVPRLLPSYCSRKSFEEPHRGKHIHRTTWHFGPLLLHGG